MAAITVTAAPVITATSTIRTISPGRRIVVIIVVTTTAILNMFEPMQPQHIYAELPPLPLPPEHHRHHRPEPEYMPPPPPPEQITHGYVTDGDFVGAIPYSGGGLVAEFPGVPQMTGPQMMGQPPYQSPYGYQPGDVETYFPQPDYTFDYAPDMHIPQYGPVPEYGPMSEYGAAVPPYIPQPLVRPRHRRHRRWWW